MSECRENWNTGSHIHMLHRTVAQPMDDPGGRRGDRPLVKLEN